jgi:aspartate/methionine/tyrosine aminotransferase
MNVMSAFRDVPCMGAVHVLAEAMKKGFTSSDPDWCNLGQGQPEVGVIEGAPARVDSVCWSLVDQAYASASGLSPLREVIAEHYNRLYRAGRPSKYRAENIAVAAGGRVALSRLIASLGSVRVGYQTPDYMAYEDMLASQAHRLTPLHVPTSVDQGFRLPPAQFASAVKDLRLDAYLLSNPCNPTGQLIEGADLAAYVDTARTRRCALLIDEFYSHFIFESNGSPAAQPVSAARFVEDVDRDPVVLIDGLTKNFRYPGWRIGWMVGPASVIEQVTRVASGFDGGPSAPMQRAVMEVLSPAHVDRETRAVREWFAQKRRLMIDALREMGIRVPCEPRGTFYVWGDLSALPTPLDDADAFLSAALDHRVMVVPGRFFDINPNGARAADPDLRRWMRFSAGPTPTTLREGLSRLQYMIRIAETARGGA